MTWVRGLVLGSHIRFPAVQTTRFIATRTGISTGAPARWPNNCSAWGIQPSDRVATLMRNHYAHLEAYFGIPCCGGIVHTLNFRLHPDELVFVVKHAEDRVLILDQDLLPQYEKIRHKVNISRVLVFASSESAGPDYDSYEEFLAGASGRFEYPKIDEDDAAAMAYTSGTTGNPKGVLYSHR